MGFNGFNVISARGRRFNPPHAYHETLNVVSTSSVTAPCQSLFVERPVPSSHWGNVYKVMHLLAAALDVPVTPGFPPISWPSFSSCPSSPGDHTSPSGFEESRLRAWIRPEPCHRSCFR